MKEGSFNSTYTQRRSAKKLPTSTIFIAIIIGAAGYLLLIFCTDKMYNIKSSDIAVVSVNYDHSRDDMVETISSVKQILSEEATENNEITVPETYSGEYKDKNFAKAYNILVDLGWQNTQICAALGNLCAETGDSPRLQDINPKSDGHHKGLVQWDSCRYETMKKYCAENNYAYDSLEGQIRFMAYEATDPKGGQDFRVAALKNPDSFGGGNPDAHKNLPDNFWTTTDLNKATKAFALCYEGCVMTADTINASQEGLQGLYDRQRFARECWEIFVEGKE